MALKITHVISVKTMLIISWIISKLRVVIQETNFLHSSLLLNNHGELRLVPDLSIRAFKQSKTKMFVRCGSLFCYIDVFFITYEFNLEHLWKIWQRICFYCFCPTTYFSIFYLKKNYTWIFFRAKNWKWINQLSTEVLTQRTVSRIREKSTYP